MRAIVIGAGIGGLATALSLHAAGIEVDVYEAVATLRPLGVGINLLPHAVRELAELGLDDRIAPHAILTSRLTYANRFGQEIWSEPRGRAAGYAWPQYSIHRGTLQMLLLEAVKDRIGPDRIHTACPLVHVEPQGVAHFRDQPSVEADVVIAADGIHSTARAQFYPSEGPPIWNRRVLWRGVTPGKPFLDGRTMVMAGHQNQKFVCYPIGRAEHSPDELLINWIAELEISDTSEWRREDWNRSGDVRDFLPRFESWRFPWLDVPEVIRGASHIFEYPMVDRDPLPSWTFGQVTLLGDAAHPMYPIGSNGASQAILDARILAYELSRGPVKSALAAYEQARRPPTAGIVLLNRGNGPEQVMQIVHQRAPDGFQQITDVIDRAELETIAERYKVAAGFDCATLNARASFTPRGAP